jgi:hypothetical protein
MIKVGSIYLAHVFKEPFQVVEEANRNGLYLIKYLSDGRYYRYSEEEIGRYATFKRMGRASLVERPSGYFYLSILKGGRA